MHAKQPVRSPTLALNPKIDGRWRGGRLDAVPPQHQKMRRKALRMLLRRTDAAMEELRDDENEMLRGECACECTEA